MKAWKQRFRRFEGFYKKGELQKHFIDKIADKDGVEVLNNWFDYCREKHGDIKQEQVYK